MKIITICLSIVICAFSSVNAQWVQITSGVTAKLDAIHFIDSQTGYTSGGFTNALKTTDGGNNWTLTSSQGFRDYSFIDNSNGYGASISSMAIAKTSDGGNSWTSLTPPTGNSLWGVATTSSSTAYFVGTGGTIWKTTNSGSSFTVINTGPSGLLTDVVFTSSTTGFILAQTNGIHKTTNSGTSWTLVHSPSGLMTEMCFPDANTGYAVGTSGLVVKTTDGGNNWTSLTTGSTGYFQGVHFFDVNTGIVVGTGGQIYYTNDGGTNWHMQTSGTTEDLYDVRMLSATSAVVTGDNGMILKNTNIIVGIDENITNTKIVLYPSPTKDVLNIVTDNTKINNAEIFDITGKQMSTTITQDKSSINVANLAAGTYFIKISTDNNTITKKFIKE